MQEIYIEIQNKLADAGFISTMIPIQFLEKLKNEIQEFHNSGMIDKTKLLELYSRYNLDYQHHPPEDLPDAQSIILTAVPQPKYSVKFNHSGKDYSFIIPPTYIHDTDDQAERLLSEVLNKYGHKIAEARLPKKLLAAHAGLASYGKNNISYIEGLGSFYRLCLLYSDLPCESGEWTEMKMLKDCEKCEACMKKCPTGTILKERFLIDVSRCLTLHNESYDDFPEWIDPSWHNCLIGCMICQDICPANKKHKNWMVDYEEFSETETSMLLKGPSKDTFPESMVKKLERLYNVNDPILLPRNLRAMMEKVDSENIKL